MSYFILPGISKLLNSCRLIFHDIHHDFLFKLLFSKILLGIPSEDQTVWIHFVWPDLGLNCLPRLSADNNGRQEVNELCLHMIDMYLFFVDLDYCRIPV